MKINKINQIMLFNVICICAFVIFHPDKSSAKNCASSIERLVVTNDSNYTINYPNPSRSSTMISYKVRTPGNVTIILFDLLGKKVCECNEGFKDIGEFKIRINLDFLSSGVYIYEIIISGERIAINTIVILK